MSLKTDVLTPQQVSGLSDNELSEAVARYVLGEQVRNGQRAWANWGTSVLWNCRDSREPENFGPDAPGAVLHVVEHTRQHWASGRYSKVWSIGCDLNGWRVSVDDENGTHRVVSQLTSDADYPGYAFGRGVFEAALLSMLEERT